MQQAIQAFLVNHKMELDEVNMLIEMKCDGEIPIATLQEIKKDLTFIIEVVSCIKDADSAKNALEKIDRAMGEGMEASSFRVYLEASTYIRENIYNLQEEIVIDGDAMESAAKYLYSKLKAEDIKNIKEKLHANPDFSDMSHFGLGMGVRNCLRNAGFTEKKLCVDNLDDVWVDILKKAIEIQENVKDSKN